MARTPSMTTAEAEQVLGPRGHLNVNSDNRATVRKWIVAQGFPALFVGGLSMRELALAYNQTDGAGIAALQRKFQETETDDEDNADDDAQQAAAAAVAKIGHASPAAAQNVGPHNAAAILQGNDPMALLREILLGGYKPGLDENRVREIVQDTLAGVAPRVVEIRNNDKPPVKIEGIIHPEFERCLKYLSNTGPDNYRANIMLVGPAGCGKTYLAKQLAKALSVDHTIVGGTAGASEGDLIGRLLPGEGGKFDYVPSKAISLYERGNALICFDEIDGFDPNMLMVANMPLANSSWFVHLRRDEPEVHRGDNVYFMATANTYGTGANPIYAGRNPMDGATRDRFIFITVDYDTKLEESIAAAGGLTTAECAGLWEMRNRAREAGLRRVISTRAFQKAAVMKTAGETWKEIRGHLLEDWTKDERAKIGV